MAHRLCDIPYGGFSLQARLIAEGNEKVKFISEMRVFLFLNAIGNLISALRLNACQRELVQGRFHFYGNKLWLIIYGPSLGDIRLSSSKIFDLNYKDETPYRWLC